MSNWKEGCVRFPLTVLELPLDVLISQVQRLAVNPLFTDSETCTVAF